MIQSTEAPSRKPSEVLREIALEQAGTACLCVHPDEPSRPDNQFCAVGYLGYRAGATATHYRQGDIFEMVGNAYGMTTGQVCDLADAHDYAWDPSGRSTPGEQEKLMAANPLLGMEKAIAYLESIGK